MRAENGKQSQPKKNRRVPAQHLHTAWTNGEFLSRQCGEHFAQSTSLQSRSSNSLYFSRWNAAKKA
jgi:hypothetical protein